MDKPREFWPVGGQLLLGRLVGWAGLVALALGCDRAQQAEPHQAEARRDSEEVLQRQLNGLKALAPRKVAARPVDPAEEDRLRRAVTGHWVLRDVPASHYRMLDESRVEKVDQPYADPYLDLEPDGTFRATHVVARSGPDPATGIEVFGREERGQWAVVGSNLQFATQGSNHTSLTLEKLTIEADVLTLTWTNGTAEKFWPKVYVRRR